MWLSSRATLMTNNPEAFRAETPFGLVQVLFPDDGGVEYDGPAPAVTFLQALISEQTGEDGAALSPQAIDPADLLNFCQPAGAGVKILPPLEDETMGLPTEEGTAPTLDAVSPDLQAFRDQLRSADGVRAKLSVLGEFVAFLASGVKKGGESETEFGLRARGKKTRERLNARVTEITDQLRAGRSPASLTDEEVSLLKQYSGKGGLTENSQFEYYTPTPLAEGTWALLQANGFQNGNVLEPATGAGVFSATKPAGSIITGAEIDPTAATVNATLHPDDVILNQSFEKLAVSTPDNHFDAVVGNVPFGNVRGKFALDDPDYRNEKQIERYFLHRVIDKTRPGGLITLVVPAGVIGNTSGPWKKFRAAISRKAEFLGGHKLPSKTFGAQGTDVVTDIIVMRKHPADLLEKIDTLPVDLLERTNVLWDEFIAGRYWQGEGKRFIHGQYIPPDKSKFRSMEQVIPEDGSTPESLKQKLAMRFDSRIDWPELDSAEPVLTYYATGDRRIVGSKEMIFDGVSWSEVQYRDEGQGIDAKKYGVDSMETLKRLASSPEGLLELTSAQAFRVYKDFPNLLTPQMRMAVEFSQSQPLDAFREQAFRGSLIGSSVTRYLARAGEGVADDDERKAARMLVEREFSSYGHPRSAKGFYLEGEAARYFGAYLNAVDESGKVSDALAGEVTGALGYDPANARSVVEYLVKAKPDGLLTLENFKAAYAGGQGINSLADVTGFDGVAITPDGFVTTEAAYCCGEIYVKAGSLMAAMEGEADPRIKAKYQSQIDVMMGKARRTGIEDITFGLRDKWVLPKYKLEFLKQEGYALRYVIQGEKESDTGATYVGNVDGTDSNDPNGTWVIEKYTRARSDFPNQLEHYMNGRSIGHNVREKGGESADERIARFREQINALEERFGHFMQTHNDFGEIERAYNLTFNNYVAPDRDTSDLGLEGVSPQVKLHWYQNQAVRQLSEEGTGILGHDVGLGKSYQAIAFSAYDRQMGRSKKHCIVVPKAVLANWYMESKKFLGDHQDVMFVGFEPKRGAGGDILQETVLDENGNPKKNAHTGEIEMQDLLVEDSPAEVYQKMHQIPQSTVGMVIMTYEKFATIPMREESRARYAQKWAEKSMMSNADAEKIGKSYQEAKSELKAEGDFANDGTKKKQELPYFEDMGFDRVIVDEAHSFKNSFGMGADASKLAYLPNPMPSQRARDMAMKTAWMREKFDGKGTILLTATPVANSPIEIFNMLSLVVDQGEFERLGIYTPDDFVRQFGMIQDVEKVRVSGEVVTTEGLAGFKNLNALRGLFHRYANMKNAGDVDPNGDVLRLPQAVEMMTQAVMSEEQQSLYETLRREAKDAANPQLRGKVRPMFAVIRDMDRVTTDMDLFNRTMTFHFKQADQGKLDALIAALPAKITTKVVDEESGEKQSIEVEKETTYRVEGDTIIYVAPENYEDAIVGLLGKMKISSVSHPLTPKYARLLENMRAELDSKGKQIVFTEEKSQHGKLARLIMNNLPVTPSQVAIINATTADGEKLQQISDAYNRGDVRIIVANKKAEVGVNLQKGTSAIHHMTLPWNPASIQQRNGRGVRQGNTAPQVRVYYYQATGSFDEYRLDLLKNKGNWIAALMDRKNTNDKAENAAAMGALEQAALLSDNREEFLKMVADQKAAKAAEEKLKRDQAAKVKLTQLSQLTMRLASFDDDKAKAHAEAQTSIEKARVALEKAIAEEGEGSDKAKNRAAQLSWAESKAGRIDPEWEKKKVDMESQRKQSASFLRGMATKGTLPFDSSVIDDPLNTLVTTSRTVVKVGGTYRVKTRSGSVVVKVDAVELATRMLQVSPVVGYFHEGRYKADDLLEDAEEVVMTAEEIEVAKALDSEHSYAGLAKLGKAFIEKYRNDIRVSGEILYRDEAGALRTGYGSGFMSNLVFPDPQDKALKSELSEIYGANESGAGVTSSGAGITISGYRLSSVASAIYGPDWRDILGESLKRASDADISAKASEIISTMAAAEPQGTVAELTALAIAFKSGYKGYGQKDLATPVRDAVTTWMRENAFVNMSDATRGVATALEAFAMDATRRLMEMRAQEERMAAEAVKSHPDFKEVPQALHDAFQAIGIDAFYNTEDVETGGKYGGKKWPAFSMLFLKDRKGKNGRIFAVKEMLKGRFRATFCSDVRVGAAKYGDCTWVIPATNSPQDVFDLLN